MLVGASALLPFTAHAQYQGDVRLTRTGAMTPASSQGVLYASVIGGGILQGSGTGADVSLLDRSANTLFSIGTGAMTLNAATWTIGNNYVATRTAGVAAAGVVTTSQRNTTFSGNAAGTTNIFTNIDFATASGANNYAAVTNKSNQLSYSGSATATLIEQNANTLFFFGTGSATNASVVRSQVYSNNSGGVTGTLSHFGITAPNTGGSSATFVNLVGLDIGNIGTARATNSAGIKIADFTNSVTSMRGIQSSLSAGTGKHNIYADGTATNLFGGALNITATTAVAPASSQGTIYASATGGGVYRGSGTAFDVSLVNQAGNTTLGIISNTHMITLGATLQAALGTPANGTIAYCSDCTIANPCAGGGTGALAKRLNGAWVCN